MHLTFRGANDAFTTLVRGMHLGEILTNVVPSRYGEVMRIEEPVIITYEYPRERVLFNVARDCNHFFHMFESLWMLAGRNDIEPLAYYSSQISKFSDDGKVMWDAYGYRWRNWFGWDQVQGIIEELKTNPWSRRCVLQMWDGEDMGEEYSMRGDFYRATHGGKAVPCNVCAMFEVEDEKYLNMTVINRSNDLVLGMLGANVVHFSMLQEYMACCIGLEVGKYHQISNNLHAYTKDWNAAHWLSFETNRTMFDPPRYCYANDQEEATVHGGLRPGMLLVKDQATFDKEVKEFIDNPFKDWREPWLENVAKPMMQAFAHHKVRQYGLAIDAIGRVVAQDWNHAGYNWITKRHKLYSLKNNENPYTSSNTISTTCENEE